MISNRNVDSKVDYILLKSYSSGGEKEIKKSKFNTIEDAIDNTVKMVNGGEFIKNVLIYKVKKGNHEYYAVAGDVWGLNNQGMPNVAYNGFKVGDRVQWKDGAFTKKGIITSLDINDPNSFIIKDDESNKYVKVKYKKLVPIGQSIYSDENKEPVVNRNKTNANNIADFKIGDNVTFQKGNGILVKGKIIAIEQGIATIEYPDPANNSKTKEIELDIKRLTKSEK